MVTAWAWSERAISALQQIARRWEVNISGADKTYVPDKSEAPQTGMNEEDKRFTVLSEFLCGRICNESSLAPESFVQHPEDNWLNLDAF